MRVSWSSTLLQWHQVQLKHDLPDTFRKSLLLINTILGAFFVTFGPRYGMRQMIISRFSFGILGGILAAVVNVLVCLGWSVINSILAAQLLTSVSDGKLPTWAGIVILSVFTVVIAMFGYRIVHHYERFSWIPMWIIFFIILGEASHYMTVTPIQATGATEAGNFLSFAASIVGYNPGWVTCAADYSVNQVCTFLIFITNGEHSEPDLLMFIFSHQTLIDV